MLAVAISPIGALGIHMAKKDEMVYIPDDWERHSLSAQFPEMDGPEFAGLKASLKEHGIQEPIYLYEGKILDGWNRARALRELKMPIHESMVIEYTVEEFGITPEAWSVTHNLNRRQLSAAQKIELYKRLMPGKVSVAQMSRDLGISAKTGYRHENRQQEKKAPKATEPDTLESLQKKLEAARNKVAEIEAKIEKLQSTAKPKRTIRGARGIQ